ncbi:hypothetical protein FRC03_002253 [Tulasnella sp. 419]|nr:hypothetical protein FRC03_002253 [Tulasnella sp. 419]
MISLGDFIRIAQDCFSEATSFQYVLTIFGTLGATRPLLLLHNLQRRQGNRRMTAWITATREIITRSFRNADRHFFPEEGEDLDGENDEDEEDIPLLAPTQEERQRFLHFAPEISSALGWGCVDEPNEPNVFDLDVLPVLVTKFTSCIFCQNENGEGKDLRRSKKVVTVNVITRSYSLVKAHLVTAHCINCGVDYHPDRIVGHHNDSLRQFYIYDAPFLRISKPAQLWVDRTIAVAQAQSILQHQTFSGYATWFNKVYSRGAPDPGFTAEGSSNHANHLLTNDQSHRMFVEHMVRRLGAAYRDLNPEIFHTSHDPTTAQLVKEALQWFVQDGILPGAQLHNCEECTHPKRYNQPNRGLAPPLPGQNNAQYMVAEVEDEDPEIELPPLPATQNNENAGPQLEMPAHFNVNAPQDQELGREPAEVNLVVMDGTVAGHAICNAPVHPRCRNPPYNFKSARFCDEHRGYNHICGIKGCNSPTVEGSMVCNSPAHQLFHAKFLNRYGGRSSLHTVRRAVERRAEAIQRREEGNGDGIPTANLPPLPQLPPDGPVVVQMGERVTHTFQADRVYCVQLLTFSCGYPIAFCKFYESESESQAFAFIKRVWPDPASPLRPTYLSYDRACSLLRHIVTSHPDSSWLDSTKFIVDVWHYIGHRVDDVMCRTRCNPAPSDGSQPDLIIKERDHRGNLVTRRAFNTETAEQLNAWFGSYKQSLNRMTDFNFDFFIYCVLFLYSEDWIYRKGQKEELAERRERRAQERAARNNVADQE